MNSFNIAFSAGNAALTWNAIMLALGILVAVVVSEIIVKKRGAYKDLALDACIVGIPAGLIGGRLFSAISGKIAFSAFFDLTQNGLNLPGALLFVGVGIVVWLHIKKIPVDDALDLLMPGAFFGLAVGRWSDFFLCDGLGAEVGASVPKFFPLATFTPQYFTDHATVAYAVFFLDFLVCLALGITALLMKKQKSGRTYRLTVILYLFAEFILEWLRVEWPDVGVTREIVFGEVRFNQLVLMSMLVFFVGLSLYRAKHPVAPAVPEPEPKPDGESDVAEEQPEAEQRDEAAEQPDEEKPDVPDEVKQPDETSDAETADKAAEEGDAAADGGEGDAE